MLLLDNLRLFLNKHMTRRVIWFRTHYRECCLVLCCPAYRNKGDVYAAVEKFVNGTKSASFHINFWLVTEYRVRKTGEPDHETVTCLSLVFTRSLSNQRKLRCKLICSNKTVELDRLNEMFDLISMLVPGKP